MASKLELSIFNQLYRDNLQSLIILAKRFVPDMVARDIVQDIFVKVWYNRDFYLKISTTSQSESTLAAYLRTSVLNACKNHLRHKSVVEKYNSQMKLLLGEIEYELKYYNDEKLTYDNLHKLIESLPDKGKEVFNLFWFEGKKASEIAEICNISVRTVETHIYKSMKYLREKKDELI